VKVGQVDPPMKRCQAPVAGLPEQRKLEQIDMKMDYVEVGCPTPHIVQHDQQARSVISNPRKPQSFGYASNELSRSRRIPAREESDVVALTYQFFREP
jgi:hypothetical protein